ncbi:Protein T02B11.3 a [Aphelenchoides avenae]|nr:Protein T02B11.3 a [Aphelenchus avenae]
MKLTTLICVVFVGVCSAQTAKQSIINKIKNLGTTFCTDSQLSSIIDKLAKDCYNMKTLKDMGNGIVTTVMGSLTGTQLVQGMKIYNGLTGDLGGMNKAMATMDKAIAVAENNVGPFFTQVQSKVKTMKANGKTQAACINQEFTMVNNFVTKARLNTIIHRLKNKLTATEWSAIKKNLGPYAKFSLYGL